MLYAGLMITEQGPQLIEYNVRFGDPECQVLMLRLKSDLLAALVATCDGVLDRFDLRWHDETALTVVMAAEGYPGSPKRGTEIKGLDTIGDDNVIVFHAGTERIGDRILASGGRVLNVTARGQSVSEAQTRAYSAIEMIDWPAAFAGATSAGGRWSARAAANDVSSNWRARGETVGPVRRCPAREAQCMRPPDA